MAALRPDGVRQAEVAALATYLPEATLSNDQIVEQYGDWSAEKIHAKTGIASRHVAVGEVFTSDLAVRAAESLFAQDESFREDIDLVVMTTITPDYIMPCTAALVQDRLGLPTTTGVFDVTLACSGYVYGMTLAASQIESGRARRVLLLTADRFSSCTETAGQQVRTIIGDGASATLLQAAGAGGSNGKTGRSGFRAGVGAIELGTDGSGAQNLVVPTSGVRGWTGDEQSASGRPVFEMEGSEVFDFTLRTIAPHIAGFLDRQSLGVQDVDLFVLHQANLFMLEHLRRRLKIREEQFVVRIEDVGNTVSTSIPLALHTAVEAGRVQAGARILLVGFGTGYSWGSVMLHVPADH